MENVAFRFIQTGTPAYEEIIALRMKVLLGPIGIPRTYINPEKEAGDTLIGAYLGEQLVGCCILTRINDETVQLRQMAVDTSLQKKGSGTLLLRFAERTAREKGYATLMMHARDSVLTFYRKCGYEVIGEQFFEVGIPHHKMQKHLQSPGAVYTEH